MQAAHALERVAPVAVAKVPAAQAMHVEAPEIET
jgi:hypothetical protein